MCTHTHTHTHFSQSLFFLPLIQGLEMGLSLCPACLFSTKCKLAGVPGSPQKCLSLPLLLWRITLGLQTEVHESRTHWKYSLYVAMSLQYCAIDTPYFSREETLMKDEILVSEKVVH